MLIIETAAIVLRVTHVQIVGSRIECLWIYIIYHHHEGIRMLLEMIGIEMHPSFTHTHTYVYIYIYIHTL